MQNQVKIVVFDLDETLGYFVEFGIFWEALNTYFKGTTNFHALDQIEFNEILDLYPEFIRPNIFSIFKYLKHKIMSHDLAGVMIYTNNQGPKAWVNFIKNYFEKKINYFLFIHIIAAFKVNGRQLEMCRTTHDKTLGDFFRCTKLPENTQICFLDDTYYPSMNANNVYYIKVRPYTYDLPFETVVKRFIASDIGKRFLTDEKKIKTFYNYAISYMLQFQFLYVAKTSEEYEIDKIVTKKTMVHLQTFFDKNKTYPMLKHKVKYTNRSKTLKNRTLRKI